MPTNNNNVTSLDDARGLRRKLTISTGATRLTKTAKQSRVTWPMLVDKMREPVRTKETYSEYLKLAKSQQDQIKDVGWFVGGRLRDGIRKKDHLESRDLITLDIDFADAYYSLDLFESYEAHAFAVYSTHKHNPESPRLRLVFPTTRAMTPDEYPAVARMVASWWDVEVFDDTTYQASRVMYWPSCSSDADFVFVENKIDCFIDPDQVLAMYDDWTDVASWPVSMRQGRAIENSVTKAADPWEKPGIVGDWCRAYSIPAAIETFLSDVYTPGSNPERYSYTGGSTSNGAIVYNDGRFLYSNHGTDPVGGRSVNAFDLVRVHLYGSQDANDEETSPTKLASFKAMTELVNRDPVVAEARIDGLFDDWEAEDPDDDAPETVETLKGAIEFTEEDKEALKALERNKDGEILNHITNAQTIVRHDKRLKGAIALNVFQQDYVQMRDLPGFPVKDKVNGDLWEDGHDAFLVSYIHKRYNIELPPGRMAYAINNVGRANQFHPVREYLNGLKWDGVERLDRILVTHLKAEDSAYTRAVTRKTLVAAVARIFNPGVKFDTLLILEGDQGLGKSTFLDSLARGWFTDNVGSMGKDSVENLKGKWIGEIAELAHFKKAEVEHVKAFLSRRTDRIREAYGKRSRDFPRQGICIGTTNDDGGYLKDDQNRRFWPVYCKARKFVGALPEDIVGQLWAEAVVAYRAGETLHLDDAKVAAEAVEQQSKRQADQDQVEELARWLDRKQDDDFDDDVGGVREYVTVQDVWAGFFAGRGQPDNLQRAQIRKLFKMLPGWESATRSRRVDGEVLRVYNRITEL